MSTEPTPKLLSASEILWLYPRPEPKWEVLCREEDEADMRNAFAAHGLMPKINGQ